MVFRRIVLCARPANHRFLFRPLLFSSLNRNFVCVVKAELRRKLGNCDENFRQIGLAVKTRFALHGEFLLFRLIEGINRGKMVAFRKGSFGWHKKLYSLLIANDYPEVTDGTNSHII